MFVDDTILEEIDEKRLILELDSESSELAMQAKFALEREAQAHSRLLEEHPKHRREIRERKLAYRKARPAIDEAWELGNQEFEDGKLTEGLIVRIAGLVEPVIGYRATRALMTGKPEQGPLLAIDHTKIPRDMAKLLAYLNDTTIHPVDRAALVHLHLTRIHPFEDGNGRTTRIVQNLILNNNGLPPVSINIGERSFYLDLIRAATKAYKVREGDSSFEEAWDATNIANLSEEERRFYDMIGSRVNTALEQMTETIAAYPTFEVAYEGHQTPREIVRDKHTLSNYFRRRGKNGRVSLKNGDGLRIELRGDIDKETLECLLMKAGSRGEVREI